MIPLAALAAVEALINRALALDPESLERIEALEGKVIALRIAGVGPTVYLLPGPGGVRLAAHIEGEPDVRIEGGPLGLARLGLSDSPSSLFGEGVTIEGDTRLGQRIKRIIDELDIDWEEQLSRIIGDAAAHQIGNLARGALRWGREAGETLQRDVAEYLQYESRDLVGREELEPLLDAIDTLRLDTDRLEARIERLRNALKESEGR